MKIIFKSLCGAILFWCLASTGAQAQGCGSIDKYKLANVMNIAKSLIPITNIEIPSCGNIQLAKDYASFILKEENVKLHGGIRSEIAIDYPFVEGDTIEYRWSIMVPSNNAPGGDAKQWWLIAQWHDQPDPRLGETWASLKPQSPPVAIYIESRNDTVGIGLAGLQGKKNSWTPVPTDVWLNLRAVIHWRTTGDGSVHVSIEGHPELNFVSLGKNMLNSYQHYFKAGQYRSPTVNEYSVIHMKNIYFSKLSF